MAANNKYKSSRTVVLWHPGE